MLFFLINQLLYRDGYVRVQLKEFESDLRTDLETALETDLVDCNLETDLETAI